MIIYVNKQVTTLRTHSLRNAINFEHIWPWGFIFISGNLQISMHDDGTEFNHVILSLIGVL